MEWWMWIVIIALLFFLFRFRYIFLRERKRGKQLRIINEMRGKHGLSTFKAYYALDKIAREHSKDMARHHTCNHAGFSSRAKRIKQIIGDVYIGENCYKFPANHYSGRTAYQLVRGWMRSPGHRRNLMNPDYKKIGIGIVSRKGYIYATQIFSS